MKKIGPGNKAVLVLPLERIESKIFMIRGQKVLLSTHLSGLYGVEPKVLVQAVKRNSDRFPNDFMFLLSEQEFVDLKSQIVTSSWGGMRRAKPYAFTEQGVAMLSSVLRSPRAIQVNIAIMRTFVRFRQILLTHKDLAEKLAALEKRTEGQDVKIKAVFDVMRQLMDSRSAQDVPYRGTKIGFGVKI